MQSNDTRSQAQPQSPKRRYLALVARAEDQAGKPEGELCRKLAERLASKWPHLLDFDGPLPEHRRDIRWSGWHEHDLLIRAVKYCGVTPQGYTDSKKQIITFITDDPTYALIEQAFSQLRVQCKALLVASLTGFLHGAVPDPDPEDGKDYLDDSLVDAALAAVDYGSGSAPRKAIGAGL